MRRVVWGERRQGRPDAGECEENTVGRMVWGELCGECVRRGRRRGGGLLEEVDIERRGRRRRRTRTRKRRRQRRGVRGRGGQRRRQRSNTPPFPTALYGRGVIK